eukprot:TRINITY_DN714_c0_g1_i8.p1 TRINITY_DN714_c0_g1~~TRINITY_DN714_c0_g1_i8.p1  ORF type:complete len:197 (+),score=55.43 TRINITY_DN714_c0_g1_i8:58-648(+)
MGTTFSTQLEDKLTLHCSHATVVGVIADARNWIGCQSACEDGHVWTRSAHLSAPERLIGRVGCEFTTQHTVGLYEKFDLTTDFTLTSVSVTDTQSRLVFTSVCNARYNMRGREELTYTFTTTAVSDETVNVSLFVSANGNKPPMCACLHVQMQNNRYARYVKEILRSLKAVIYNSSVPEVAVMGQVTAENAPLLAK